MHRFVECSFSSNIEHLLYDLCFVRFSKEHLACCASSWQHTCTKERAEGQLLQVSRLCFHQGESVLWSHKQEIRIVTDLLPFVSVCCISSQLTLSKLFNFPHTLHTRVMMYQPRKAKTNCTVKCSWQKTSDPKKQDRFRKIAAWFPCSWKRWEVWHQGSKNTQKCAVTEQC